MSAILQRAATVTGLIQQAVEELHQLVTYELSSSASVRHGKAHEEVRKHLVDARNQMASLSLALGKEGL
jgi:hypothetical protein